MASTKNINIRNRYQCTPLHLAIRGSREETVRILCFAGANPALEDEIELVYMLSFNTLQLAAYLKSQHVVAGLIGR